MHPLIPRLIGFASVARVVSPRARLAITCLAGMLGIAATAFGQGSGSQVPDSANRPKHHARKSPAALVSPAPAPTPPPPPDWPINDQPSPATISWDKQVLKIGAVNSSLQQILSQVTSETGAKLEGLGQDERVFGDYGPGPARDVLSELLQGTGYNVMLAGDLGDGVPREIVLSQRHKGAGNGDSSRTQQEEEDETAIENEVDTQPQPPAVVQPPLNPGFTPGNPGPVRTPQQLMQEYQQRQQQMQQQPQQPVQPPNSPQQ